MTISKKPIPTGQYPEAFYRVSLKAVIENDKGEVLCVKENGSDWTLPGGGMDHGETIQQGLAREMDEEISSRDTPFQYELIGADTMFLPTRDAWQIWLMYRVVFDQAVDLAPGVDADDMAYIDPRRFRDSDHRAQRLIYKWRVDNSYDIGSW